MHAEVTALTDLADLNKETAQAATDHVNFLSGKIEATNAYLVHLIARQAELAKKRVTLAELRCVSNMRFIISLKEHQEALDVIALLKADVVAVVEEHTGIHYEGLAQIKNKAQQL